MTNTFKPKKNTHPTKRRPSIRNIQHLLSDEQLSIPNLSNDLTQSTSLGIINEREDESYNFQVIDTNISLQELNKYKLKYYTPESIYERLLSQCNCKLCEKPSLEPSQSYETFNNKKRNSSVYDLNGLLFRTKSLSIYSTKNILKDENLNENICNLNYGYSLACLCNKDKDLTLIQIMSIGDKNNINNFMHILNDINSKIIFNNIIKIRSPTIYNINNDIPLLMLPIFKNINTILHQAIKTYHKRLAKPLDFNPKYIIYDNINEIIDIIKIMTHIVKLFVNGHGMPFQFDLLIIFENTQINEDYINTDNDITTDDDDEEEEEGDDDDDEITTDDDEKKEEEKYCNNIDDIGNMFINGLFENHYDHFYNKCIILDRTDSGIKTFKNILTSRKINVFKKSTQNGRYVIIIDRGGKHTNSFKKNNTNNTNSKKDYMYFFQPPKPWGDIIGHLKMIEILHLNTLECLLPKSFKNIKKEEYYGAKNLCNREMICISFHVLSEDEIRCYLYVDNKYIRIDLDVYLEKILSHYIKTNKNANKSSSSSTNRTKYNKWAFQTRDGIFEDYFHWIQQDIEQNRTNNTDNL